MAPNPAGLRPLLREVVKSRAGSAGVALLSFFALLSLLTPAIAPLDVATKWEDVEWWRDNPSLAAPAWMRALKPDEYSETIVVEDFLKYEVSEGGYELVELSSSFVYNYGNFPTEIKLVMDVDYGEERPHVIVSFMRPDGEEIPIYNGLPVEGLNVVSLSLDARYQRLVAAYLYKNFGVAPSSVSPEVVIFARKSPYMNERGRAEVLRGLYEVRVKVISFEGGVEVEPRVIIYGNSYGVFGTDSLRRDLLVGIIWGAPVALAFGTVASVVTVLLQVIIGAAGVFIGPRADEVVQRFADFLLIIPVLPLLILINVIYGMNVWALLGLIILFSAVGVSSKVARSMALQIKGEQYVEAAISYGASKARVLFFHVMPRMTPYILALIALSAPAYIFLEASLSFLGLGDPNIPTWGRILGEAYAEGALYLGYWWWVLFPALMIMLVSLGFTLLAYSLDKIVNPLLREE